MSKRTYIGERPLCAHPGEEDGIDPRRQRRDSSEASRVDRRGQALGKQVHRAIDAELACLGRAVDWGLGVHEVEPSGRGSTLTIRVRWDHARASTAEVMQWLAARKGALRSAVAAAITRKRVPELTFAPAASKEDAHDHAQ